MVLVGKTLGKRSGKIGMSNKKGKESRKCSRLDVISKKAHSVYMKKPKVNRGFCRVLDAAKSKGNFLAECYMQIPERPDYTKNDVRKKSVSFGSAIFFAR